ncbi:hypothetical protein INS49_007136 [Diaporthe citri]|uniref:uncharacterized protein n=1 Tax=Diaporthe citri TaxID=83186 RepID=UPI001C81E4A9|nr:uncharacterized protein INS49_007136 [Diaporthe citri]KAG6365525.1 hypothetical protein INS49_007136 [Diaporthe citri]
MATDGANDPGESRRRIILDNVIYEPVSSVVSSRQQRSQVSMYNYSELRRMDPYKYKGLRSMRRRLRLLRLHGGGLLDPEITCELFEVEYDKDDQNIVRRVLSKDERSAKRESVLVQATGKVFRRDGNQATDSEDGVDTRPRLRARRSARKGLKRNGTGEVEGSSRPSALAPQRPLLSLEYLVSSLSVFRATQPRDAVYSMLAISRDTAPFAEPRTKSREGSEEAIIMSTVSSFLERKPFRVDYSRAYSDVCKDFISFCIQISGRSEPTRALDILCRPWAPDPEVTAGGVVHEHRKPMLYKHEEEEQEEQNEQDKDISLPSWISCISGASFALYRHPGMHKAGRIGRMNADPLVGLPQDGHKNYSAAQNTKVDFNSGRRLRFRKRPMPDHCSLYTEGYILAKIESVAEPARLGAIPETWTKVAGWENAVDGQTDPPVEFWRTLVADRGKDGRNPPYYYATACRESVRKGGLRGGSVNTGALINSERNSIIADFCRRVQAVVWNRCLIKTGEPLNVLGLASQHVQKGDLIRIIFGCTVPVILRRKEKREGDPEKEKMQDRIESMKAAMEVCEETCSRKLRYQKRLQIERARGKGLDMIWKKEVLAELKEVNSQMRKWREREEEDKERKIEEAKDQEDRKDRAKHRQIAAKMMREEAKLQPLQKSKTMPDAGLRSVAMETAPSVLNEGGPEQPEGTQSTHATPPQAHGQDGHDAVRETGQTTTEQLKKERQKKKDEARVEDPKVYYEVMGEAYIHGMMDGEAVRRQINEDEPTRMFEIR